MGIWEREDLGNILQWDNGPRNTSVRFKCGYCGTDTTPPQSWLSSNKNGYHALLSVCTSCRRPSLILCFNSDILEVSPNPKMGNEVLGLPEDIEALYGEARAATGVGAYTAAVLTARKILMHISVEKGAATDLSFVDYVDFLDKNSFIPRDAREWVDHIRKKSNEANHEILIMKKQDAEDLIAFTEMLLRLIYEFKFRLPKSEPDKSA